MRRSVTASRRGGTTGAGWAVLTLCVVLTASAVLANHATPDGRPGVVKATAEDFVDAFCALTFPLVGALLLARRGNRIGWVFGGVGLAMALSTAAGTYADYRIATGQLWGVALLQLLLESLFGVFIGLVLIVLPLLLPNGRLRSARWRPLLVAGIAFLLVSVLATAVVPGPVEDETPFVLNPFGVRAVDGWPLEGVLSALLAALALPSLSSLVLRVARPQGHHERRQVGSIAVGVAVILVVFFLDGVLQPVVRGWGPLAPLVAIPAVPLATYLALVRRPGQQTDRTGSAAETGQPRPEFTPQAEHPGQESADRSGVTRSPA